MRSQAWPIVCNDAMQNLFNQRLAHVIMPQLCNAGARKIPVISFTEAAKLAGVNPSTIHRAVKNGRLSARTLDNGRKAIDPSELERVFPSDRPRIGERKVTQEHALFQQLLEEKDLRAMALQHQVQLLESERVDLRSRLDRAEQERGVALRLLEDQRSPRSWWPWCRAA